MKKTGKQGIVPGLYPVRHLSWEQKSLGGFWEPAEDSTANCRRPVMIMIGNEPPGAERAAGRQPL